MAKSAKGPATLLFILPLLSPPLVWAYQPDALRGTAIKEQVGKDAGLEEMEEKLTPRAKRVSLRGTLRSREKIRQLTSREQIEAFQTGKIIHAGFLDPTVQQIFLRTLAGEVFEDHTKVSHLMSKDFSRPIEALGGRNLMSLWKYYYRWRDEEHSSLSVIDFMLTKLGFETRQAWSQETWLGFIGKRKVDDWSEVPAAIQKTVILTLANHLEIPVAWLWGTDFSKAVPALQGKNVRSLFEHYRVLKAELQSSRPELKDQSVVEFMQLRLGLPTMREASMPNQIEAFRRNRVHDWSVISAKTKQRLIQYLREQLKADGRPTDRLTGSDFRRQIQVLVGRNLSGLLAYYERMRGKEGVQELAIQFMLDRLEWERLNEARLRRQMKQVAKVGRARRPSQIDFSRFAFSAAQMRLFWRFKRDGMLGYDVDPIVQQLVQPKLGLIDLAVDPYRRKMDAGEQEQFAAIGQAILRQGLVDWDPNRGALDQVLYVKLQEGLRRYMPTIKIRPAPFKLGSFEWSRPTLELFYLVQAEGPNQVPARLQEGLLQALRDENTGLIQRRVHKAFPEVDRFPLFDFENYLRVAIWQTIDKYDPEKGAFSTILDLNVRGAITTSAQSHFRETGLHIPLEVRETIDRILEIRMELQVEKGAEPTFDAIASAMKDEEITPEVVREYLVLAERQTVTSLNGMADEASEEGRSWDEILPSQDGLDVEDQVANRMLHQKIEELVERLGLVAFGLFYLEGRNFTEIGRQIGVSRTWAEHRVRADIVRLLQDPEFRRMAAHLASETEMADRIQELLGLPVARLDGKAPTEPTLIDLDELGSQAAIGVPEFRRRFSEEEPALMERIPQEATSVVLLPDLRIHRSDRAREVVDRWVREAGLGPPKVQLDDLREITPRQITPHVVVVWDASEELPMELPGYAARIRLNDPASAITSLAELIQEALYQWHKIEPDRKVLAVLPLSDGRLAIFV